MPRRRRECHIIEPNVLESLLELLDVGLIWLSILLHGPYSYLKKRLG